MRLYYICCRESECRDTKYINVLNRHFLSFSNARYSTYHFEFNALISLCFRYGSLFICIYSFGTEVNEHSSSCVRFHYGICWNNLVECTTNDTFYVLYKEYLWSHMEFIWSHRLFSFSRKSCVWTEFIYAAIIVDEKLHRIFAYKLKFCTILSS